MTITPSGRRAIAWAAVSLLLSGVWYIWTTSASSTAAVVTATDSPERGEKQLARLRDTAATVPQKEEILKGVAAELAKREAGLIQADTAQQAQAQILQILTRLCASQQINIKQPELVGIAPVGDTYGEVIVALQIECHIEQLINLLADISAQPQLLTTTDIQVQNGNPKEKTINVRLAVAGITPRKLIPEKLQKKGAGL